ncbi:MAG: sensor histidine kinase [Xanthomonadaceae bacterium]|nr:sensor histidine kinase [Xanthomonadaceae bacterium]
MVTQTEERPHWLPDFCSLPVLFAVMVVAELLVLVAEIAPSDETRPLLPRLATVSVFAQWLALVCAVCLCKLRPQLEKLSPWLGVAAAYALMLAVTVIGSALVFDIDHQLGLNLTLPVQFQGRFVWRSAALCALLGAALLRYFYVLEQWRARVRAEAKARFEALQARIRPHFLFNSMNTIASLIRSRPAEAERAVEDLSDLFRAALGGNAALSTLGAELDLMRQYLDIEKLRLGERLRVDMAVNDLPADLPIPALLLQPLAENAIYHGIQPLPEGGTVTVRGRSEDGAAVLEIRNPQPAPAVRAAPRNGMALDNTRARIEYHFGRRGMLVIDNGAEEFVCVLRLPRESADR